MIIYLSSCWMFLGVNGGNRTVSTDRQGARRPAALRDPRAYRPAVGGWLPPPLWVLSGATGHDFPPPQGVGERRPGRITTRWAVRVLPNAAGGPGRVHRRAPQAARGSRDC